MVQDHSDKEIFLEDLVEFLSFAFYSETMEDDVAAIAWKIVLVDLSRESFEDEES